MENNPIDNTDPTGLYSEFGGGMGDFEDWYSFWGEKLADLPGYGTSWGSFAQFEMAQHEERMANSQAGYGFITHGRYSRLVIAASVGLSHPDIGTWEAGAEVWVTDIKFRDNLTVRSSTFADIDWENQQLKKFSKGHGIGMLDPLDHMALMGIFSAIKSGLSSLISAATRRGVTYEIGDGVRRATAADRLGKKTITAVDSSGKTFQIPIKNLRSPKSVIDLSKPGELERFRNIYHGIKNGDKLPAIYVNQGSRGVPIPGIKFKF